MNSDTSTEPIWDTRPTSLRPRSTSITCSARSFGVALHLGGQPLVVRLVLAPGMGARDGALLDTAVLHARPALRGGADDARLAQAQEEEIRRRVDAPERAVHGERIRVELRVHPPRDHDLVGVARRDVLLGLAHALHEGRFVHARGEALLAHGHQRLHGGEGQGRGRPGRPASLSSIVSILFTASS